MKNPLFSHDYMRTIRAPDGTTFWEQFGVDHDDINGYQTHTFVLMQAEGDDDELSTVLGIFSWRHQTASGRSTDEQNSMPDWWSEPPMTIVDKLVDAYGKAGTVLPTTLNVVTFVTYMEDGRAQLQRRGFVTPNGKPVNNAGDDSINGGGMRTTDQIAEVIREAKEELGKDLVFSADDFAKVGDIYDPEAGRSNHVYRVVKGYDTLLKEQLTVEQAVDALTNPEGIGRDFVWLADLQAIRGEGRLTGISEKILTKFPELLPPPRP